MSVQSSAVDVLAHYLTLSTEISIRGKRISSVKIRRWRPQRINALARFSYIDLNKVNNVIQSLVLNVHRVHPHKSAQFLDKLEIRKLKLHAPDI